MNVVFMVYLLLKERCVSDNWISDVSMRIGREAVQENKLYLSRISQRQVCRQANKNDIEIVLRKIAK